MAILRLVHLLRAHVGMPMADELNEADGKRVDVDAEVARLAPEELHRHVVEGALGDAHRGWIARVGEIAQLGLIRLGEQDVLRLDVEVRSTESPVQI